jgi:hypothetical protein
VSELTRPGEELLAGIAERDYERIAACFDDVTRFSVLTPTPQVHEHATREGAAGRYRLWLEPLESYELLEGDVVEVADRVRIRYLFRGKDPAKGWQLNEHTAYAEIGDGRIRTMTLTCAGFRPTTTP